MSSNSKTRIDVMKESEVYDYSFPKDSIEPKERIEAHKIRNVLDHNEKVLFVATQYKSKLERPVSNTITVFLIDKRIIVRNSPSVHTGERIEFIYYDEISSVESERRIFLYAIIINKILENKRRIGYIPKDKAEKIVKYINKFITLNQTEYTRLLTIDSIA